MQQVGVEGMFPIYGNEIKDGTYPVEVESSSGMFRIEKALLTVKDGEMSAELVLNGTSYRNLFVGTGMEAAATDISDYIANSSTDEAKTCFIVPVEALDHPISCAAFSRRKEKWYDRQILFRAESLPKEAVFVELPDYKALKKAAKEKRIAALKAEKKAAQ